MKILVTAGPTREYLDDIRFVSNASSGKAGFAIAEAAARAGHAVTLVAGPVTLPTPPGVNRLDVVSAEDLRLAVIANFEKCDALVMTAAVCDYRPARRQTGKIKKDAAELVVPFVRNPDILGELGARKGNKILIGFALEVDAGEHNARIKMRQKNLDAIVLNSPAALGADRVSVEIIERAGRRESLSQVAKSEVAARLVALLEELAAGVGRKPDVRT